MKTKFSYFLTLSKRCNFNSTFWSFVRRFFFSKNSFNRHKNFFFHYVCQQHVLQNFLNWITLRNKNNIFQRNFVWKIIAFWFIVDFFFFNICEIIIFFKFLKIFFQLIWNCRFTGAKPLKVRRIRVLAVGAVT